MKADTAVLPISAALALFLFSSLSAQTAESGRLRTTRTEWRVAVAGFTVLSAGPEADVPLQSTAGVIPRLLIDRLDGADLHELGDGEMRELAQETIRDAALELQSRLTGLHRERDDLFFAVNANPAKRKSIEQSIDALNREIETPRPVSDVDVPQRLPIVFPLSQRGGAVWELEEGDPVLFRRERDLDLLITGKITRVGEYFGLRISAWDRLGETVLWEGAASGEDLESVADAAGNTARGLVLGRPWSAMSVSVNPPDATITLNGERVGVGSWSDGTLRPGEYEIMVSSWGHSPQVEHRRLFNGETVSLNISLEPAPRPQVLVNTIPDGAWVRQGSLLLGRSPLTIGLPDRVMPLTVELEGYRSRTIPLLPATERLTIPLEPALVDPAEQLAADRKKLYNSITWFSFSLAPTIILLGVSQNYANMNLFSTSPDDLEYSYDMYRLTSGLMWGSVGVNLALLTNVLIRLSRYLGSAEKLTE